MEALPTRLYTPEQVRELDRRAIEDHGIPGERLMERAGRAAYRLLRREWPGVRRVTVLCGGGNNGGDGYVIARLAAAAGLHVRVVAVSDPARLSGAAAEAMGRCRELVVPERWDAGALDDADVVVDALLGTGLDREVAGDYAEAIGAANARPVGRLAVDVPSGISAATGACLGVAFRADVTPTFIGLKQGLFTGAAPDYTGAVCYDDLDVPPAVFEGMPPAARRVDAGAVAGWLAPRSPASHKGHFGHVLVIGGDHGFGGAVRLAAEAAARTGSGLVSVATRKRHIAPLLAACPEAMAHAVDGPAALEPLLEHASVVAIGPGLGQSDWGRGLLAAVGAFDGPLVADADALNLLAAEGPVANPRRVITPHPGEAARLLRRGTTEVQRDRFAVVDELLSRFGGAALLKGAGTLIGAGDERWLCTAGNPGMASGGMGDVLTGVVAGLLAQGLGVGEAAAMAAAVHGGAADRAAVRTGPRALLARDVIEALSEVLPA